VGVGCVCPVARGLSLGRSRCLLKEKRGVCVARREVGNVSGALGITREESVSPADDLFGSGKAGTYVFW